MTTTPAPASQPSPAPTCPTCKGSGNHPRFTASCEECDGSGRVEPPSPARSDKEADESPFDALGNCKRCRGKFGHSRMCPHFDGDKGSESIWAERATQSPAGQAQESAPSSETIDGKDFRALVNRYFDLSIAVPQDTAACEVAWGELIDFIDARRATAGTTAAPSSDMETDYAAWIKRRGALGPGAIPERIFFAGWSYGQRATAGNAAPTDEATREFDAARLRRLVRAVGLEKAVPTDDVMLLGCLGTVLGQIAGKVEKMVAAPAATAAPGDLPLKLVDIISHGYEGWANLIYTGDDCPGLPVAMLAPFFVPLFRKIVASNAGAAPLDTDQAS